MSRQEEISPPSYAHWRATALAQSPKQQHRGHSPITSRLMTGVVWHWWSCAGCRRQSDLR